MILFNYTTRSRPANFFRGLRSIENNCITPYKVLVSIDEDDYTMNNDDVKSMLLNFKNIVLCIGTSKNKIVAINRDINEHLETLKRYTAECSHVTEMGVRNVVSTWAFLSGNPKKYIGIDINPSPVEMAEKLAKEQGIDFTFIQADTIHPDAPRQ